MLELLMMVGGVGLGVCVLLLINKKQGVVINEERMDKNEKDITG